VEYLKPEQFYIDLYDLFTINHCLDKIRFYQKAYKEHSSDDQIKDLPDEEKQKGFSYYLNLELFSTKANRYKNKMISIDEWVERDTKYQEKYDNTPEPTFYCPNCKIQSISTFKTLINYLDNEPARMLFFMECPKCNKREGVYDNSEIRITKPDLCPKCGKETTYSSKNKGDIYTITTKCKSCSYKNVEVEDFEKSKAEREQKEKDDISLLEKYRKEFCLDDKEGKEHVETVEAMEVAVDVYDEEVRKYDNQVYQRSLQLKKTTISDLEKILTKCTEKAKYTILVFDRPEINQYVTVPFTIQDTDSTRTDRNSATELEKLIENALKDTNWRLLSSSVSYRLGYLEGRLKGYECEEDMLKLAGKTEEPKPKSKVDAEKLSKYSYHNLVQFARISGKFSGVENTRKRRLEKDPEGFFLETSEGPLQCGICGRYQPGNEIWWNLDGLRCADCWRNIKEGIIPPNLKHMYSNDGQWIADWQVHSDYNVHPATRDKFVRQGFLKARQLKDRKGAIYCALFLVSENKEFLDKYPKKPKIIPKITFSKANSNGT
jgi:hypothetical protein